MAGKPKGSPKTGGRQKGTPNRSRSEVIEIIESIIPLKEQIKLLAQLSRGVLVQDETNTAIIYQKPPDVKALNILIEHRVGKPMQVTEITSDGESPVKNPFVSLAEILIGDEKLKRTISEILDDGQFLKPTNGTNGHE